jgi:hypothetical protein
MFVLRALFRRMGDRRTPASRPRRMSPSLSVEDLESRQLLHGGGFHIPHSLRGGAAERQTLTTPGDQGGRETLRATIRRLSDAFEAQFTAGPEADFSAGRVDADGFIAGVTRLVDQFKQDVDRQLLPAHPRAADRLKSQGDVLLADLVTQLQRHDESRLALHIHPHLAIEINGRPLTIPANIGITPRETGPVHTHDDTGKIHVESEVLRTFYLKDFFAAWGRTFTRRNLLGHRADATHEITMTVNGQPSSEFGDLVLRDLDEIVIRYGPRRPGGGPR